jgi:hypothetical protein
MKLAELAAEKGDIEQAEIILMNESGNGHIVLKEFQNGPNQPKNSSAKSGSDQGNSNQGNDGTQ